MKKLKKVISLFKLNRIQLIKKINTLEIEKNSLKEIIKEELYKTFMDKLKEPQELARYKKENKNLRLKIKTLNQLLKDGYDER